MSELTNIEPGVSRRELLRSVAMALTAAGLGSMSAEAAQHVHHMVEQEKKAAGGVYQPKCFNPHEYQTLQKLAELVVPADANSPGALAAGAPEFIDLLASQNDELAAIYTGGIAWLDAEMERRGAPKFLDATPEQQTAMLDRIAYRSDDPELGPGIRFFDWARKMTVDAFYTSKAGIADLGYMGNQALAEFRIPEAAIQYALKRSGL